MILQDGTHKVFSASVAWLFTNDEGQRREDQAIVRYTADGWLDIIDSGVRWAKHMAEAQRAFVTDYSGPAYIKIWETYIGPIDENGYSSERHGRDLFEWKWDWGISLEDKVRSETWRQREAQEKSKPKPKKRGRKRLLDTPEEIERVCELYFLSDMSAMAIAHRYKVSPGVVTRVLDEGGTAWCEKNRQALAEHRFWRQNGHYDGMTREEIEKVVGR